ncbi:sulfotransferase family protein [Coleofasciculus sp. F4-SAH-05]|uniref:sulfotransferase family protein n=1 Tax=Coleofasciculus sp. F4-SAH-05 TaxID=3069525 RepID=UPI0033001EE8
MTKDISLVSQPIFLVGAERSGTTVLRLMLDHHPDIAWCYEFEYAVDKISNEGDFPSLDEYYKWLETHRIFQDTGFTIDRGLSYPQLINSFLGQKQEQAQKPIIGATVHRHFDRLLHIFPDARFIHLIRDSRDVARSCIGMGWAGNVYIGVERWIEAESLWAKLSQNLSSERRIEVTYEALIKEPVETLTQLCNFIGLPYNEAMLSYAQKTTYDLPDPSLISQWKRKLSEREIQLVESRVANMLVERGYELSGLPSLKVTSAMKQQLKLQSWWVRVQGRVQRYGIALFLADYLSRRLKINLWQKRVRQKLNVINKSRLK